MSVILSNEKSELIKSIAKCQGFDNYKVEVTSGSMKGDGYLGIINTVSIQDSKKPNKDLNLIIKSAMTAEKLRENAPVRKAYEREIYMYETVFPEFKRLSEERGIMNKFTETAKCYGTLLTDQQESIVLEDLKKINFKLWNRKLPMNKEHVALVFATYAKFHATGLAIKLLKPEKFAGLTKNLKNIFSEDKESEEDFKKFEESIKHVFSNGFQAVANNEKATAAFQKFVENCKTFFTEDIKRVDKYTTILHGDCWCNNMMFKYEDIKDPSKPTQVCLLDWQISHFGSPILDLSYFLYACCSKETLNELEMFLRIYYDNFRKTVKEAGLDPQEVLTYDELVEQWKVYSKYGLFMTLFVMKVILSEVDEAPDLSELAEEGKNIIESITCAKSSNLEAVNQRIADVIVFMEERDYL